VIGMARTGMAAAEALTALGARAVLHDAKPASELTDSLAEAGRLGVETRVGSNDIDLSGFDLVIPSPGVPAGAPVFAEARSRGIEIISEIELAYRISRAPIIAFTGTNGKTTTTVLTGLILRADGRETCIAGNVVAGDIRMPLITAAHTASPDGVIVAEISTFQLEWIQTFRPKVAGLLNVTADHLDRHASIDDYAALKARIFENQTGEDYAVINAENAFTASLAESLAGRVLRFSRNMETSEGAFVRYAAHGRSSDDDEMVARIDGREVVACHRGDIRLRGEHNVENVLAASCAAIAFGARPQSVATAVEEFNGVEHRLESVAVIDGIEYVNNSMCTNVDAAVRSVEAFDVPQVVISGGKDKGSDYAALGEAFARKATHVVLIGVDAGKIERAAREAGFESISRAGSMREAVETAREHAVPGGVVVLTPGCASFDMFSSFEHRGQVFKAVVRKMALEKE